jgi:hypothetical protein
MGSPQQKAEIVAGLIGQFGIDINTLDNMLVGRAAPPEVQQQSAVQQAVQQAVAPYQQTMAGIQQQQQQQAQQAQNVVAQEVNTFGAAHEFYKDVRPDMIKILDSAAATSQEMSMEDAYTMACNLHPQIAPIMAARNNKTSLADKRRAAVSISGGQGGALGTEAPDLMTDQLNAAWDQVGRN